MSQMNNENREERQIDYQDEKFDIYPNEYKDRLANPPASTLTTTIFPWRGYSYSMSNFCGNKAEKVVLRQDVLEVLQTLEARVPSHNMTFKVECLLTCRQIIVS